MALDNILYRLVTDALLCSASDIHISSGAVPALRIDGDIKYLSQQYKALNSEYVKNVAYSIMTDRLIEVFEKTLDIDFAYDIKDLSRLRVNIFSQNRGVSIAIRLIPKNVLSLEQLNLPSTFKDISCFKNGLVLITGATGSGKSTTLSAMIDYINSNFALHIVTIEDPIEFVYDNKYSLINQRELGNHTQSFNSALKASMRADPDVILVGEMRDAETIRLAITAAETGHLVFATLHTNSAISSINRIIDTFNPEEKDTIRIMLAESLRAVVSQSLLKKKESSGRVLAYEIMIANYAIKNLIKENKISQIYSCIQTGMIHGMHTLDQHLLQLVKNNQISSNLAQQVSLQKNLFI